MQMEVMGTVESSDGQRPSTILVVDDKDANRLLIRHLFDGPEYRVLEAADGLEGVAVAKAERPDCILLDLDMPRLGGFEALEQLEQDPKTRQIPVIILTATDDTLEGMERALRTGAVDYITKPISPRRVAIRVRGAIERRRLLQELEDLRSTFTSMLVHDLRAPLAVIKGIAEELAEEFGLDPTTRDQLKTIRESAAKASTIVTDLLKFARQSTPEMERHDMKETIESSVRLTEYLARKSNVQVKLDLPRTPVMVTYDAQQIEQVLMNLISNAIQAIKKGGAVRINLSEASGAVAIAVQDNGIGIPEKNLLRIFDPFFTTKPEGEGTGLGLSVSFGIITRHRGRIEVDSKPGLGTTFTILLPIDQDEVSQEAEQELSLAIA